MNGEELGCYRLVDILHTGRKSVIYRAHDEWMNREVAVKMLSLDLAHDVRALQCFNHEAKAAGNIVHPNVITAFDFGMHSDTMQAYLVLEYVDGRNLAQVVTDEGALDAERVVDIFVQACDAMSAAHDDKVLHCDLKPSHIMLVKTTHVPDFVKIVDFGRAKMMDSGGKSLQSNEVSGTPFYMSPEQFMAQSLDARSDVYAMGCSMYEALTGHPPLEGNHAVETMYKVTQEIPKPFSEIRPDLNIPQEIESVVMRALEKDPEDRYQSMAKMRDALLSYRHPVRMAKFNLFAGIGSLMRSRKN